MSTPVILDAIRTPFGRRGGALRGHRPDALLSLVLQALVARNKLAPEKIDDVIAGCVSQAGEQAANVGRLAVLLSGLPARIPGVALNRMCGSSQQAVHFAAQAIAAGDAQYVLAGGVENMTRVPMFTDITLGQKDFLEHGFKDLNPALFDHHALVHQVESAERIAEKWQLARPALDAYAIESHRRAWQAIQEKRNTEIIPMQGLDKDGHAITLMQDEGVREKVDAAKMATLNPVFRAPGTGVITAANSSQISDGAAMVLVADEAVARADGYRPRARFRARVVTGVDPVMQLTGVIPATHLALQKAKLQLQDIDWIEVNEAFSSVALCWAAEFKPDMQKVNPWGGAIAHGHPLGGTGAGLMAKLLTGLEATGGTLGMQVMCIGHGMATATIIERV